MFKATNSYAAWKRVQEGSNHWDRGAVSVVQHTDKAMACLLLRLSNRHALTRVNICEMCGDFLSSFDALLSPPKLGKVFIS
ncbi:hypothetical protein VNO77_08677 [Canavalia gladiata]|uniref:Uncharacterized protein n=1 Tax=Canavalia gladiata TaxID=3824 RepID=A0AAN9MCD9_CANGL